MAFLIFISHWNFSKILKMWTKQRKDLLLSISCNDFVKYFQKLYRDMFPYMFLVTLTHSYNSVIFILAWGQLSF